MRDVYLIILMIFITGCAGTGQIAAKEAGENIPVTGVSEEAAQHNADKKIAVEGAFSDFVVVRSVGPEAFNTSEIHVIVGNYEQRCTWSTALANPGDRFACRLPSSCTGMAVLVIAPGNMEQGRC